MVTFFFFFFFFENKVNGYLRSVGKIQFFFKKKKKKVVTKESVKKTNKARAPIIHQQMTVVSRVVEEKFLTS